MKKAILLTCAVAIGYVVSAQSNFSGKWIFVNQESVSGTLYGNGSPVSFVVKQDANSITIERTSMGADKNNIVVTETILFGGKPTETKASDGSPKTLSATWSADKKSFVLESIIYNASDKSKQQRKIIDTWTMDNGRLLLQRKSENFANAEVWESKAWYEKN